jgi:cobalt-zinc-cadmium efflux system protein
MAHTHGHEHGHAHGHDHGHDHHAAHGHHHHHGGSTGGAVFALCAALNLAFVVAEALFGAFAHSIALMADAGHNLGDVLSLGAAWAAASLARRGPSRRYTYGLKSSSILVALLNAIILLVAVGAIILASAERLISPAPVAGLTVIVVALVGVAVNGGSALALGGLGLGDLNVRAAYAHMAADAAVSLGVAATGAIILYTGWARLDPVVSIVVALIIVVATWRLLRQALDMALDAVPAGIEPERVRAHLAQLAGVSTIHDLHIWPMSTTETALTAHLVMPGGHPGDVTLAQIATDLQERFAIGHATLQIETDPDAACALAPDHVV